RLVTIVRARHPHVHHGVGRVVGRGLVAIGGRATAPAAPPAPGAALAGLLVVRVVAVRAPVGRAPLAVGRLVRALLVRGLPVRGLLVAGLLVRGLATIGVGPAAPVRLPGRGITAGRLGGVLAAGLAVAILALGPAAAAPPLAGGTVASAVPGGLVRPVVTAGTLVPVRRGLVCRWRLEDDRGWLEGSRWHRACSGRSGHRHGRRRARHRGHGRRPRRCRYRRAAGRAPAIRAGTRALRGGGTTRRRRRRDGGRWPGRPGGGPPGPACGARAGRGLAARRLRLAGRLTLAAGRRCGHASRRRTSVTITVAFCLAALGFEHPGYLPSGSRARGFAGNPPLRAGAGRTRSAEPRRPSRPAALPGALSLHVPVRHSAPVAAPPAAARWRAGMPPPGTRGLREVPRARAALRARLPPSRSRAALGRAGSPTVVTAAQAQPHGEVQSGCRRVEQQVSGAEQPFEVSHTRRSAPSRHASRPAS